MRHRGSEKIKAKSKTLVELVKWLTNPSALHQMDLLIAINSLRLTISRADFNPHDPVDGTHFGQPWCQPHGSGRVCHVSGHTSSLRGPFLQALTLLRGTRFIGRRLRLPLFREMPTEPEVFWGMLGGPTIKWPCATLVCLVGRAAITVDSISWIQ